MQGPEQLLLTGRIHPISLEVRPLQLENTQARNLGLRDGQIVQLPDVNLMRTVVLGEGAGTATMAVSGDVHYEKRPHIFVPASTAPAASAPASAVLNPPIAVPRLPVNVASSAMPAPEVTAEEKKKWVRFP